MRPHYNTNMTLKNTEKYIPADVPTTSFGNSTFFEVPTNKIVETVRDLYFKQELKLKIITATDERKENDCFKVFYVFGSPAENIFIVPFIQLKNTTDFPSVARFMQEAWNYERKIRTFFGLNPVGHPDTRPIILHENWPQNSFPLRKDFKLKEEPSKMKKDNYFAQVEGEGIYEIPVGPIHAGIIEPGHFRFNVAGEEIVTLEPKLGYVHKGVEKLFEKLSMNDKLKLSERISGDSSFHYSLAYCQAVESLGDIEVSESAKYLRVIFAELERMANHMGDIGAIMIDTGFNFGGANGARLREMMLQVNERYGGSRFLRGVNKIGGVSKTISKEEGLKLVDELSAIVKDFSEVIAIAKNSASLLNRLKGTGILKPEIGKDYGAIGVPGRAAGLSNDARKYYSYAAYDKISFEVALEESGDVYARYCVRIKEVYSSFNIIKEAVSKMPAEGKAVDLEKVSLKKNAMTISLVEGWRGDVVFFVQTDGKGEISRVDLRDPSFLHWPLVEHAGPGNIVPDFPLINKSLNLSYSGNDL